MNLSTSIVFGSLFGLVAGACAFAITYTEYKRNWTFTGSAARMALRTGAITFLVFLLAAIILPWLFEIATARG